MLNRPHLLRIDAIRQGFDDRLPTLVEYDPSGTTSFAQATECIHAWREIFEDELEVLAFVRIDPARRETQCAAVRHFAESNLPVAVAAHSPGAPAIDVRVDIDRLARPNIDRWTICNSDLRSLLMAARIPADLLLCECEASLEHAARIDGFAGIGYTASDEARGAFAADFARRAAAREEEALGPVLAPFGPHEHPHRADADVLLGLLADAVYQRRIRCAA